jgi:hypothetical protein
VAGDARYVSLATFRRTGAEVRTPVWCATLDGRLYLFTAGDSGKVKRLRHTPRVRVAPCDVRGIVSGPWREGVARIVADPATIEQARAAIRAKYGRQARLVDFFAWLAGRLPRRAWIEIEL